MCRPVSSVPDFAFIVLSGTLLCPLGGCVRSQQPAGLADLESRVTRLEQEVRKLESARAAAVHSPFPDREPVTPRLQDLLNKRRRLLEVYTEQHPEVRLLDRKIFELEQARVPR